VSSSEPEHPWDARSEDVGVEEPNVAAGAEKRQREVDGDG
jgi:hypothetical protein